MIPKIKSAYILIVEGIYLDEIIKHANKDKTIGEPDVDDESLRPIPATFETVADWPKNTRLHCWACAEKCDDYPRFIPSAPRRISDVLVKYDTHGVFCTWNCAIWYAYRIYQRDEFCNIESHMLTVRAKFEPDHQSRIILPSPDKTIMRKYCGNGGISAETYKEKIRQLNNIADHTVFL